MERIKKKLSENRGIWAIVIYAAFYLPWFIWLEKRTLTQYSVIHMAVDDIIPFCEYFIVFYYIWFLYMIASIAYCVFTDHETFYRSFFFIATGMTLFLLISTIFPNGHHLRPSGFARDNIFTMLTAFIYRSDTPTNIFPSIHVYNAIGAHLAIVFNKKLKNNRAVKVISLFTCIGIILSTVFLKQHSMYDVLGAIVLAVGMYPVCFRSEYMDRLIAKSKHKEAERLV